MKSLLNGFCVPWTHSRMSNLNRSGHRYDLRAERTNTNPHADLDRFSLRKSSECEATAAPAAASEIPERVIRRYYQSCEDLRSQWKMLDRPEDALRLTVVLMLNEQFDGYLPGVIRRSHHALRLLIASPTGKLPGLTTVGDLALHSGSLGWHLISFHRTLNEALTISSHPMTWHERCVLFCPESQESQSGEESHWGGSRQMRFVM